tara:strand:+ start:620 stop:799 length:180 start_codon:yes stop_codon:yes gene_type:complete
MKKLDRGATTNNTTRYLTEGDTHQLVDSVIRSAMSQQARMLEKHLHDIDVRISKLENKK